MDSIDDASTSKACRYNGLCVKSTVYRKVTFGLVKCNYKGRCGKEYHLNVIDSPLFKNEKPWMDQRRKAGCGDVMWVDE